MNNKKIIAILGLPGSGKSVVIDYLMEKYILPKVYFGDVTFDELKSRGLEINEKNERIVREDLREKFGKMHYCNQIIKKIEALGDNTNILVESLYSWEEYLAFIEKFGENFIPVAIYTSPENRYRRLSIRKIRPLTEDVARSRDYAQIVNISQAGPIAMAKYTVNNNGTLEQLYKQVDDIIKENI